MSGFSDERKNQILEAAMGSANYKEPGELFLALVTVAVTGADKGTTITEANYTGYARIPIKAAEWAAAAEGKRHNNVTKIFAECTAGESKVIGWALCTTEGTKTGLVVASGTIPSTLIQPGITPEFVSGALVFSIIDT